MRTLTLTALLIALVGCSKDADPTPDAIIETGYVECTPPADGCAGLTTCTDAAGASVCVQAPADACAEAITCECVGDWLCGDLPCAAIDGGISCGVPDGPPPGGCLQVDAEIDLGEHLIFDPVRGAVTVRAICAAEVDTIELVDGDAGAGLLAPPALPAMLAAGEQLAIEVELAPPAEPGERRATVRINRDPTLEATVRARFARPIDARCLEAAPQRLDYGTLALGEARDLEVQLAASCTGALDAQSSFGPEDPVAISVVEGLGAIQAGEGGTLTIRAEPRAEGAFAGTVILVGLGDPLVIEIVGRVEEGAGPGCGACEDGQICSALNECVTPIEFVIDAEEGANATWFAMPRGRYFEAVRIAPADAPEAVMIPFMPCDACDAPADCAQQPERVGLAGSAGPLLWDGVRWRTDTLGDDCSRPVAMEPGDYLAVFCVSEQVELDGAVDPETGVAPGRIMNEACLPPVPFTWPAEGRITAVVPAID